MSILDVISGKKPLLKSTQRKNWVGEVEADFEALINAPFKAFGSALVPPLKGVFDSLAASRDYELAKRGGGDLQSIRLLTIPVTNTGEVTGSPFDFGECTGILLAPRTAGDNGQELESSDTARIYIQINNSNVWIPVSFNLVAQGSQKGDAQYISGPIARFRIIVTQKTQDPTNQPNVYLWLMRGITVVGQFGAAVGYNPPGGSSSASAVISPAPGSPPPGGGGGGGSQGGGGGGGQQGGGGGGGRGGGGGGHGQNLQ